MHIIGKSGFPEEYMAVSKIMPLSIFAQIVGVEKDAILGSSRHYPEVTARHLYCYYLRQNNYTLREAGEAVNRSHATALNSINVVQNYLDTNDVILNRFRIFVDNFL